VVSCGVVSGEDWCSLFLDASTSLLLTTDLLSTPGRCVCCM
jgi:hypothetical protein